MPDSLPERDSGYLVLGCTDITVAFAIPVDIMATLVVKLNATTAGAQVDFWHLEFIEDGASGWYALAVRKSRPFALDHYCIPLP